MSLKVVGLLAPIALGGLWVSGALGGAAYSRDVDRSPAQVMEALADLDIREQPGEPGTDLSRSGGVQPVFRTERGDNQISFLVMSGDRVATRMTAFLEPIDDGQRTRVTAAVERGDAPDDFVSPAFRSTGITMGLFAMALEGELDELVAPPRASAEVCQAFLARFEAENIAGGSMDRPETLKQAAGQTARTVMRLHAMEAEMRRAGCPTDGGGAFRPISSEMGNAPPAPQAESQDQIDFRPGQPMVDVSR